MADKNIQPLKYESYIAVIKNSIDANIFKNFYAKIDGKTIDVLKDGELSCAFYVSSILTLFNFINKTHATVTRTIEDLEESGWKKISEPVPGSVLVWEPVLYNDGETHAHIGFYIGDEKAISIDWTLGTPQEHSWGLKDEMGKERNTEAIFWNEKISIL